MCLRMESRGQASTTTSLQTSKAKYPDCIVSFASITATNASMRFGKRRTPLKRMTRTCHGP